MRNQEHDIREAMAADVADVVAPADLADRVRVRYRHHRRVRAARALAVLALFAVAAPLVSVEAWQLVSPADRPAVGEVDDVELTYLPDGLRRDPIDGYDTAGPNWTAVTGRWYPEAVTGPERYQSGVRVTVFRGSQVDFSRDARVLPLLTGSVGPEPLGEPLREEDGRTYFRTEQPGGAWIDVFWPAGDDVTLRVRVSEDLERELERIIRGLRVVGPGRVFASDTGQGAPPAGAGELCAPATNLLVTEADTPAGPEWSRFGGVVLHHVPDGLDGPYLLVFEASGLQDDALMSGMWSYWYSWRGPPDARDIAQVQVTCGESVPRSTAELPGWATDEAAQPYPLPDGRPALIFEDGDLTTVTWVERPGAVVRLRVSERFEAEVDEILAGIEIIDP